MSEVQAYTFAEKVGRLLITTQYLKARTKRILEIKAGELLPKKLLAIELKPRKIVFVDSLRYESDLFPEDIESNSKPLAWIIH